MADGGRKAAKLFDGLSMYAFVVLGLPDGMIGTAWPAVRRGFGAPLEDIGIILLAASFGGVATSSVSGLVVSRLGTRLTIMMAATVAGCGALLAVLSPVFVVLVVAGALIGMAAGFLDGSVNIAAGMAGRGRLLNLLHGCYGIGTTLGPLVVTGALLASTSWRPAYGALVVVELGLLAGWWWAGKRLNLAAADGAGAADGTTEAPASSEAPATAEAPASAELTGPAEAFGTAEVLPGAGGPQGARLAFVVGLGLLVFLVYTGMEVGAGQWEPSYARGPLHMGTAATGVAVFGYWAALTLVRLALAVPRRPPKPAAVVRWGCLGACAGSALIWWGPSTVAILVGFVIVAGSLAGVFPALVVLTPARVGEGTAHHVIGWQIGAAGAGGSLISALFGVIFQHLGFQWFGPCLVIVGVILFAASEALARTGSARRPVLV